ncbi:hypothetical protein H5410_041455 [Solanum commersonii]|uniref:Uncharacterized protein n=1 Tax=Solanum commersonii TaxID=4109 RepID=A0A9J5XT02_SOLCO|nr:hypothetical protein H5410_041455 [Solanum commersonii]
MMRWMCGHTRRERIKNEDIQDKVEVASMVNKMRDMTLIRWACEEEMHGFPVQWSKRLVVIIQILGKPDYVLACKLKALKHKLKEWSKEESGNLGLQRKKLLEQLAEMDMERENRVLTEEEITKKAAVLLEYEDLIKKEEIAWRQRSRILWLKEGDKNTKFFHKMANSHRRYNNIDQLMIQGEVTHEPAQIEGEIITYYKKLYTEPIPWRPTHQVFLSLKGISWAMPRRITEALKSWEEAGVLAKDRTRWRIIPPSIWWATWKERNSRCFESVENSMQKVKLNCI